jgi:quercetin dioxygenase-like cupin family protein
MASNGTCEAVAALKVLTPALPRFPDMVREIGLHEPGRPMSYALYDVIDGEAMGFGLYNEERVAVQRVYVTSGSTFSLHNHDATEHIIVFEGEMIVNKPDDLAGHKVLTGESIVFPAHQDHEIYFPVGTWAIVVAVPSTEGFPV